MHRVDPPANDADPVLAELVRETIRRRVDPQVTVCKIACRGALRRAAVYVVDAAALAGGPERVDLDTVLPGPDPAMSTPEGSSTMLGGVLLDIDGTLLLSNDAHARAWVDAYREFGYDVPFEAVRPLIGMGGDKLIKRLTPDLDESQGKGKEITERRRDIFLKTYAPHLQPAPGARDLLLRLKQDGVTLAIATSAKDEELETLVKAAGIADLIEEKTTSDDADQSKPDPDIVQAALEKSGLDPDEVLMLGDAPYDIESAGKLEIDVVAVRCGGHSDDDLNGAIAVYDDPADLLRHFDQSPIGERIASSVPEPAVE